MWRVSERGNFAMGGGCGVVGFEVEGAEMSEVLRYCDDLFSYQRRETREVMVGKVGIGGANRSGCSR